MPAIVPMPERARRFAVALAVALVAGLSAGCSALTTIDVTPGRVAGQPRPVAGTRLFDWRGIVHCHSHFSHDCDGTIEAIAAACKAVQIDFVVMTDHQTDASIDAGVRGFVGDTLFLVGAEVRSPQGTLLAFPLARPLRNWRHAGLLAAEARAQGGLAFVCHAESWQAEWNLPGIVGAEIVNLHAGAMAANKLGTLGTALFLPLRSLLERICRRDDCVLAGWDRELQRQHPFTPVGGNDAHESVRVFGPLGGTLGTYREVFATLTTHVLAERLDEASLVEAMRLGRTYVSFDVFGEGAGFDFRAEDDAGVHVVGATVSASGGLRLLVRAPAPGRITLYCDGRPVASVRGDRLESVAPAPGVYRVEVCTPGGAPWLFSSSIRVR